MPRNKASRLRLAQEPEPEPEQRPVSVSWSQDESTEAGTSRPSRRAAGDDVSSEEEEIEEEQLSEAAQLEAQLHAIYRRADRNGDGSLKRAELVLRVRKDEELAELLDLPEAGHAQRKAIDGLFAGMDSSGDGEIDEDEFVQYFVQKAAAAKAAARAEERAAEGAAAEELMSMHERIERIYEVHAPAKLPQIEELLGEWEGDEDVLYENIKQKYEIADDFFAETESEAEEESEEEPEDERVSSGSSTTSGPV